jgi:hypothetical protein
VCSKLTNLIESICHNCQKLLGTRCTNCDDLTNGIDEGKPTCFDCFVKSKRDEVLEKALK